MEWPGIIKADDMDLVVDTNVLLACFKKQSITRRLLGLENLHCYTPEHALSEMQNNILEISNKFKLSELDIHEVMDFILESVEIAASEEFIAKVSEAKKIVLEGDAPFLALAIQKDYSIWSNDLVFKKQKYVSVFTTKELIDKINFSLE